MKRYLHAYVFYNIKTQKHELGFVGGDMVDVTKPALLEEVRSAYDAIVETNGLPGERILAVYSIDAKSSTAAAVLVALADGGISELEDELTDMFNTLFVTAQ